MKLTVSDFSAPYTIINGQSDVEVTPMSLTHAAITVGADSYTIAFGSNLNSFAFVLHKVMALLTVVEFQNRELTLPKNYRSLDQSEKASLGYWAGMAMSKLVAEERLDVQWLQHVGRFKKEIQLKDSESRSTPDLVGLDKSMNWHVIEAKARQNKPSDSIRKQWKNQAGRIAAISGAYPTTNSYCLTLIKSSYSAELVDPTVESDRNAISLNFSRKDFLRAYYRPILDFLDHWQNEQTRESGDIIYRPAAYDPVAGRMYDVGIVRETLERVQRIQENVRDDDALHNIWRDMKSPTSEPNEYIGSDGIAVRYRELTLTPETPRL